MKASIIIPTIRPKFLSQVLVFLKKQTVLDFETIVIEDKKRKGAAWARNQGIKKAKGEVLIFIGDDTLPDKNFVAVHLEGHCRFPQSHIALLGKTLWHPSLQDKRFFQWLKKTPLQASYQSLIKSRPVSFKRFYTTNLSLKRSFLSQHALLFDENFPNAALEDIDFGYRFIGLGGKLLYWPQAKNFHFHPMTPNQFFDRMEQVGRNGQYFYYKHPHLKDQVIPTKISWKEYLRFAFWELLFPLGKLFQINKIIDENWQRKAFRAVVRGYQKNDG